MLGEPRGEVDARLAHQRRRAALQLEAHRAALQSAVAKHVVLKYTPHLVFHLDDSIERGVRVIGIMQEIDSNRENKA